MDVKNTKLNIDVDPTRISTTACDLGEGLYVDQQSVAWVDINADRIFVKYGDEYISRELNVKPSVILGRRQEAFLIGCDIGICSLNVNTGHCEIVARFPGEYCSALHRSNDGCRLDSGEIYLGVMRRDDVTPNSGGLYYFSSDLEPKLIDFEIAIPNLFVSLGNDRILIADSLRGGIYECQFDEGRLTQSPKTWIEPDIGKFTPDGGCLLPDGTILVAAWDSAALFRFDDQGELLETVDVPCSRPTNCKYDQAARSLYVTTASQGIEQDSGWRADCGHTYRYGISW